MKYTLLYIPLLWGLTACSGEDVATSPLEEEAPIELHFYCHGDLSIEPDTSATRAKAIHNPYFENVIHTLFALHFDSDGICRNCTPLTTISGSQTKTEYSVTLSNVPSTRTDNTIYVFCNFTEAQYQDLKDRYTQLELTSFRKETFSIADLAETAEGGAVYLPSCGVFSGTIQADMNLDILLARYVSTLKVELMIATGTSAATNVTLGIHQAPCRLTYVPVENSADYPILTTEDFFTDAQMTDASPIASVSASKITSAATRYFYVGENLSQDASLQSRIFIRGTRDGTTFDVSTPLSPSGQVDRNTNYERVVRLQ